LFFLLAVVAGTTALLSVNAAGAKPPKQPPAGTRGVAAKVGTPGTITITHYSADGLTMLGTESYRATASDTSASVAARAGKLAPAAVKTGVVTEWDDLGRPNAPVAQVSEAPVGTRTTSSLKRTGRKADCCSDSGCDSIDVTRDITGDIFGDWIGTFHHYVYWCWQYPRITSVNVGCWSDVDGSVINNNGCDGWGNYYSWRGSGHGGHFSHRQGDWENCFWWFGCFKNIYPWIEIWVNGNGAWAQDQGG
jgi:hypothetical protein